jgi:hypothetical protein
MKLSTFNWLSRAIALPLFIAIVNISTSAGAEQIDRSRSVSFGESQSRVVDSLPSVTDLNLTPASTPELSSDDLEQSSSLAPFWSNPDRTNSSTKVIKKPASRVRNTLRSKKLGSTNTNSSTPLSFTNRQSNRIDSPSKHRNLVATNIEPSPLAPAVVSSKNIPKNIQKLKPVYQQKFAAVSPPPLSGNYLRLVRSPNNQTNDLGNPIYLLEAYLNGQKYQTFNAVSGTATTQAADRDRGNNAAPLPDGLYDVSGVVVPGNAPEVGKTFIGIFPKFETGRNSLGIHLDRSFNKPNGYDGTAGCIGITTAADRDAINEFVTKYRPRNLFVKILSSDDR